MAWPRKHPGVRFSNWKPHEDAAILAARPLPPSERRVKRGEPKPVSELEAVAEALGRSYVAVRTRRYRLIRGRAVTGC